jgi:carbamoyltransferase
MNIIGISAYFHDSACCLLQDGQIVAAAAEERFTRVKHDRRLPISAYRYCLEAAGLDVTDIDCVAYYESPVKKLARQLWTGGGDLHRSWLDALRPERDIRDAFGFDGPIRFFDHHQSHAASAFYYSGFADAAILTVDGVGEWATTTYGRARGGSLDLFEEVHFPHSLGLLYSAVTSYLGFSVNDSEYKVMGLAPLGRPSVLDRLRRLVRRGGQGRFALALEYFNFVDGPRMYTDALCRLLDAPPRRPEGPIDQFHKDVASSLQSLLEEILIDEAHYLYRTAPSENLCMAGGVALNCVANGLILREGPFRRLFVQPAAGDDGGCLGAAALAYLEAGGGPIAPLRDVYLGPQFSRDEIDNLVAASGLAVRPSADERELLSATVDRLIEGKVIAWFHGRMEFGPRALGCRSILADPRLTDMRDRLNRLVKKREWFRPFAPAVLVEHAADHFDIDHASPYMLETCQVRSPLDLPAVTHTNGSARPQTVDAGTSPRFAALLRAFNERTGCPVLVNTSFNVRGEPIVCTPADALFCMIDSEIDTLVLEDYVIDRDMLPQCWEPIGRSWRLKLAPDRAPGSLDDLYSFF